MHLIIHMLSIFLRPLPACLRFCHQYCSSTYLLCIYLYISAETSLLSIAVLHFPIEIYGIIYFCKRLSSMSPTSPSHDNSNNNDTSMTIIGTVHARAVFSVCDVEFTLCLCVEYTVPLYDTANMMCSFLETFTS